MPAAVALQQQHKSLTRTLRVNDELSIDNGRVVIRVVEIDRRRATVKFGINPELVVDKPPKPPA